MHVRCGTTSLGCSRRAPLAPEYADIIRLAMQNAFTEMFGQAVPIEVEAKVCSHWGEK
jgi:hypothetical protein